MRNIKLIIEYDGTAYHGWQSQINAVAIQDVIGAAIEKLTGSPCNLIGASRTDVGVHAYGQVANFLTDSSIPSEKFSKALTRILPEDIVIRKSEEVETDFHSRYSSKTKKYRYLIYNNDSASALLCNRAFHVRHPLDFFAIQSAANCFIGEHDFSAFRSTGSSVKTSVRTITGVSLKKNDDIISFEIEGNGFLYNMVRIIVGTLVEVGMGKINYKELPTIIKSGDRLYGWEDSSGKGLVSCEIELLILFFKIDMATDYA